MYPEKVKSTNFEFNYTTEQSDIIIYYVPQDPRNPLTSSEISKFIDERRAYYVTDQITIEPGKMYTAVITVDLELYENESVDLEVAKILLTYSKKFCINLEEEKESIKTLISKISNINKVSDLSITYIDQAGVEVTQDNIGRIYENIDSTYFDINFVINSIVRTVS
jgi:hypothetical protein